MSTGLFEHQYTVRLSVQRGTTHGNKIIYENRKTDVPSKVICSFSKNYTKATIISTMDVLWAYLPRR